MSKTLAVVTGAWVALVTGIGVAAAQVTPESVIGSGASTIKDSLLSIATTVLPYAAAVIAVVLGWRLARRFMRA